MTLGYKQEFPWGEPTNFREKIWKGVMESTGPLSVEMKGKELKDYMAIESNLHPKLHSIRADAKDMWGSFAGDIHHVYDNRKPTRQCFLRNKFNGWQRIQIIWTNVTGEDEKGKNHVVGCSQLVLVDGRAIRDKQLEELAVNDGFKDLEQFFRWFNTDFAGKIIHWTKLRY
jgi:hypothetical protein